MPEGHTAKSGRARMPSRQGRPLLCLPLTKSPSLLSMLESSSLNNQLPCGSPDTQWKASQGAQSLGPSGKIYFLKCRESRPFRGDEHTSDFTESSRCLTEDSANVVYSHLTHEEIQRCCLPATPLPPPQFQSCSQYMAKAGWKQVPACTVVSKTSGQLNQHR